MKITKDNFERFCEIVENFDFKIGDYIPVKGLPKYAVEFLMGVIGDQLAMNFDYTQGNAITVCPLDLRVIVTNSSFEDVFIENFSEDGEGTRYLPLKVVCHVGDAIELEYELECEGLNDYSDKTEAYILNYAYFV